MSKLHLGCGEDYKEGYINIDFNRNVKADLYLDLEQLFPFPDDYFEEIFTEGTVEHISKKNIFQFFDECWRVCFNGAKIKILTNHFSSVWATQHLDHKCQFGVDTLGNFNPDGMFNGESYGKARFNVNEIYLFFFYPKMVNWNFLSKLPINWIFNLTRTWQRFMERFQFLGFDGIYYEIEVVK